MFGISGFEFLIIAGFILVVFGPEKLPEMARTVGRAMSQFNRAKDDMEAIIRAEMHTANKPAGVAGAGGTGAAEHPLESIKERVAAQQAVTFEDDDEDEEDEE